MSATPAEYLALARAVAMLASETEDNPKDRDAAYADRALDKVWATMTRADQQAALKKIGLAS